MHHMEKSEIQWLNQYRKGDVEALGRLVERYRRPLYGFIYKMTSPGVDADEIFQDTWIRAVRNLDDFKPGHLLSWLFRIARNVIIDASRKKKPDASLDAAHSASSAWSERIAAPVIGPDRETAGRDLGRVIAAAVSRLPPEQREVFLLRTEADLPFREIARIQHTSINTSLARMQYALEKLKAELEPDYREWGR